MTSIENTNVPIYEIRFPAITICNNNLVYLPRTKSLTTKLIEQGFSNETIQQFYRHLSSLVSFRIPPYDFTNISKAIEKLKYDTSDLMFELSQPCDNLIEQCNWFNGDCKHRIRKIKTLNGFCCSINYYLEEFKLHKNQTIKNSTNNPIYYVSGAGNKFSLVIVINVEPNMYVSGLAPFYGSEILIHDGFAFPEVSINPIIATVNTSVNAQIGAHTIQTDINVQSIPLKKRGCSFDGEAKLDYEYNYSYETCVSECRLDRIIKLCNCIPYYYRYSGAERFCNYVDIPCLNRYQVLFYSTYNPKKVGHSKGIEDVDDNGIDLEKCGCYPSCEDITYEVQTQTLNIIENSPFFMPFQINNKILEAFNKTFLFANYQHLTLIQYRRDVRVSWNNLLASLGGIFGLCVGGSVISIAEFLYLFALYFIKNKSTKNETKMRQSLSHLKIQPLPSQINENIFNIHNNQFGNRFRRDYFE